MDRETKEILSEADHVKAMIGSDGWKSVYGKLQNRIIDLQNINNVDMDKPDSVATQIIARKMAVQEIWTWLKSDVFGFVEQQESNNAKIVERGIESFIDRD